MEVMTGTRESDDITWGIDVDREKEENSKLLQNPEGQSKKKRGG
jgi:hypothetical protein